MSQNCFPTTRELEEKPRLLPTGYSPPIIKPKIEVGKNGVDIGAEVKPVWAEKTVGDTKFGYGLNVDTGFKANGDGVDVSFLGFGFKAENGGFGIKTPLFGFFSK